MILTVLLGKACKRCGGDRKEVSAGSLHGEKIHNLYSVSNIINVIKSQRWERQDRHTAVRIGWHTHRNQISSLGETDESM
jgi:hypothetical protein